MPQDPRTESSSKGFAGLDALISDVEEDIVAAHHTKEHGPADIKAAEQERSPTPGFKPTPRKARRRFEIDKEWLQALGGSTLMALVWIAMQPQPGSVRPAPHLDRPSTPLPSASSTNNWEPVRDSWGSEQLPPAGKDFVLNDAQVRYCVAEEIRIKAMQPLIDNYSELDVSTENRFIDDYNARCSQFRYRAGVLEASQRQASTVSITLQEQGRARVRQWRGR